MEANATIDQIVPHLTTSAKKLLKSHEVANIGARNQHKVGNTNHQLMTIQIMEWLEIQVPKPHVPKSNNVCFFKDNAWCFVGLIFGFLSTSLYKPFLGLLTFQAMILCDFHYEMIRCCEELNIVKWPLLIIFPINKIFLLTPSM